MSKKEFNKIEAALRQELANVIHDMDDGKLDNSKLHNLISKINSQLYNKEQDEVYEEEEYILPTISEGWEYYTDDMLYPDTGDMYYDDEAGDISYALEQLAYCTDKKQVSKKLKSVEKQFNSYIKSLVAAEKTFNKDIKNCIKSANEILNRIKSDVSKDLKPKKKSNAKKQSTVL